MTYKIDSFLKPIVSWNRQHFNHFVILTIYILDNKTKHQISSGFQHIEL